MMPKTPTGGPVTIGRMTIDDTAKKLAKPRLATWDRSPCPTGKVMFGSRREAKDSIRDQLARRRQVNKLFAYRCQACDGWHAGRRGKPSQPDAPEVAGRS